MKSACHSFLGLYQPPIKVKLIAGQKQNISYISILAIAPSFCSKRNELAPDHRMEKSKLNNAEGKETVLVKKQLDRNDFRSSTRL
jgi:hypothetical protein